MADGPFVESEIWQYYQGTYPGQVQVLGPDVGNGTAAQLAQFRVSAGNLTFPLLQLCADGSFASDTNLLVPYNQRDNYVVINKAGIIRYHADDAWDYGNRYHVNELRGTIDSLVSNPAGVIDPRATTLFVSATPNPFRALTTIEFSNPFGAGTHARVAVHDLAGRRVITLYDADAPSGVTRLAWDGRSPSDQALSPGVYSVLVEIGAQRITRRLVLIH